MEGGSGLGDRGISRELAMGEENLERGKRIVKGPEVGMTVATKDLKDPHSWEKGALGNVQGNKSGQEGLPVKSWASKGGPLKYFS